MVLDFLLDPVLSPLLYFDPVLAIFIISFVLTFGITLVYKYATDQEKMKKIKKEIKEYQEKIKDLKDKPDEMMKVQKEAMSKQMEMMKHSFKPTLFTFIPLIIIFGWLNGHMAYHNIAPGQSFQVEAALSSAETNVSLSATPSIQELNKSVDGKKVTWSVNASEEREYKLVIDELKPGNESGGRVEKTVLISNVREYATPRKSYENSFVKSVSVGYKPIRPLGDISIFGWHPGWLATYIVFSLVLSIVLRKLLGVV